jgi:dihydroflavonol-4-reductase
MLGSNLARELISRGYAVRAFVEYQRDLQTLSGIDIEIVRGDILSPERLLNATWNCNYVIHAAASISQWPVRSSKVRDVNIKGTENVINASAEAGVERLVFVGSGACCGTGNIDHPGDESTPFNGEKLSTDYVDSKIEATSLVRKASESGSINAVIVHPTFMLGPYDSGPGSGAMIIAVAKSKVPGYTRGGKNYIDVRDVAIATANALTMGRNGESYILGNLNASYKDIFKLMAELTSGKAPVLFIPPFFSLMLARVCTIISYLNHKKPLVSIPMAKASNTYCYVSSQKAVNELLLPQNDIRIAIADAVKWFRENRYL